MKVDPITRQTYDYATCDNNPKNIIEPDPDTDDQDFILLVQNLLSENHHL